MITMQIAHHAAHSTLLAGTGLLDTANAKATQVQATLRIVAGVIATGLVVKKAISTSFAFAAIAIAGLCAGVFMWIVFNVTEIKDRVGTEVTAAGVRPATASANVAAQPAMLRWTLPAPTLHQSRSGQGVTARRNLVDDALPAVAGAGR